MNNELKNAGFSLTEVLLAVGTLAIGLMFIGGTFVAGIYFATIATERTIAAVAADEAFAKIKLYGVSPASLPDSNLVPFNLTDPNEFGYPSTGPEDKQYYWSALCRRVAPDPNDRSVQVTVFVCRKVGSRTAYRGGAGRPIPQSIGVLGTLGSNVLTITGDPAWINDGYTIVENTRGHIYRVVERPAGQPNIILLARPWTDAANDYVWVIPPPDGGGRNPCIAVYQTEIRF